MPGIAAVPHPLTYAGFPGASWAYAIRIWLAAVLALYVSFWLQLDSPSSAAITVAILALPTRGQGLDKAVFRLMATGFGVAASFIIVGVFAQSGIIILWVFALWIGLCVFIVGLLDGNRAYAASLGVITVAIVAIEQIDTPQQVFDVGIARGSAIIVGVLAITFINDVLGAPDHHPKVSAGLKSLRSRVLAYGRGAMLGQAMPVVAAAGLLRDITAMRPDIAALTAESSSGAARAASARSAMVELVVTFSAMRALAAVSPDAATSLAALPDGSPKPDRDLLAMTREWLAAGVERNAAELRSDLARLHLGLFPDHSWRTPLYRSRRIALEQGVKAAVYFVLTATLFSMTGWPSVGLIVAFVALLIGLGATTPDLGAFTRLAVMVSPLACLLAGILQFVVLDGATGFPMLAIGLAPFIIVCALLMTLTNPILSSVGRLNMVFIIALVAPSNPQNYSPESFLVACLFVSLATLCLFALQMIVPPMSPARQVSQLLAEAQQDLGRSPSQWRKDLTMEEAAFRCALRVGQIAGLAGGNAATLDEAMRSFDQATAIRRCRDELDRLDAPAFGETGEQGMDALERRDAGRLVEAAESLKAAAAAAGLVPPAACAALVSAALALSAKPAPAAENVS
ncbi:MAG TPA: FUSC family protein [Rhizobiaceae bacterium]